MTQDTNKSAEDNGVIAAMLEVNKAQTRYYDQTDGGSVSAQNSVMTNLWRRIRLRALSAVDPAQKERLVQAIHKDWMGDLSGLKVLEVGCGPGSSLTEYLLTAQTYHAIDLAPAQIRGLRRRIGKRPNARLFTGDFLSDDFAETGYDLIFAQSFLHHFRDIDPALAKLARMTKPGGRIITFDPLQTWGPARLFRALFRPFQTDAAWEFPFGARSLDRIAAHFIVADRFGLYARAKYALAIGMLWPRLGQRLGRRWCDSDFATGRVRARPRSCLILSALLINRGGPNPPSARPL